MRQLVDTEGTAEGACASCELLTGPSLDPVVFPLVPAFAGGWHVWAASLLRLLSREFRSPTQAVVIEQPPITDRYVQLLIGHGRCYAQASSNVYLTGPSRLSTNDERCLELLGWQASWADVDDERELPANWTLPMTNGDPASLTELLLATIVGVFGFREDVRVDLRTFVVEAPCADCFPVVEP